MPIVGGEDSINTIRYLLSFLLDEEAQIRIIQNMADMAVVQT